MTTLSLNGRSYTDLLGDSAGRHSDDDDSVEQRHHGRRHRAGGAVRRAESRASSRSAASAKRANGFYVNGSDVQERMNGGTGVVPEPRFDRRVPPADEQLRSASTATTTAASSTSSPSRAATRSTATPSSSSGTRHLDARNYFSPERAEFSQNQPGGTIGGPLKRGKIFFFADYQATRTTQGIETGNIPVPSLAERAGNFSDVADSLTGTVNGPYWANLLAQRLGYARVAGRAVLHAGLHERGAVRVSRTRSIPTRAWSAPAQQLLQYMPDAQCRREHVLDRRVRADRARRQGVVPRSTATPGCRAADRATTSSTTTASTIRIPASRAARTCRASTR